MDGVNWMLEGSCMPGGRLRGAAALLEIVRLEGTIIFPGRVELLVAATDIGVTLNAGDRLNCARKVELPLLAGPIAVIAMFAGRVMLAGIMPAGSC
jgi:hypothetical protein